MNREPLYFSDDSHLADLFREAERKRPRVDWWAVLGGVICLASSAAVVTGFLKAYIWASRWYR
jgi:hypothetical protein